jgi:cytochrome P450
MEVAEFGVNLFDRSVVADPFPVYEQIRAKGPVVWNDIVGAWMATGYDDCLEMLIDYGKRFGQMNDDPDVLPWFEGRNMIQVDAPEHTRLRRCLAPFFTRQAVARWEGRVAESVDQVLLPLVEKGSFDIINDFTTIPTVIVAQMMGIPPEHYDDFQRWSSTIVSNLSYGHEDPDLFHMMRDIGREANDYLFTEIERHRREQPDDLITAMLNMPDMDEAEIRSTALLLVLAGYDTTAKLMANSLVALEQAAAMRAALVEDPALIPAAIEEVLRWTGVSHLNPRRVLQDTMFGGAQLSAGDTMYVLQGAAGRDPVRWPDPHRFDIRREQKSHLGFGFGPHLCIGAPLARLETKIALERLLSLAPEYELRDIDYGNGLIVRGPERGFVDVVGPNL